MQLLLSADGLINSTLVDEPYTTSHLKFLNDNGISHLRIIIPPNKDPEVEVSNTDLDRILGILLNKANHPVLVHCNKGKVGLSSGSDAVMHID